MTKMKVDTRDDVGLVALGLRGCEAARINGALKANFSGAKCPTGSLNPWLLKPHKEAELLFVVLLIHQFIENGIGKAMNVN